MPKTTSSIHHPRRDVGNKHTKPAMYRDHTARPTVAKLPPDASSLTERVKSGNMENTSGKYYLLGGAVVLGLYLYLYQG